MLEISPVVKITIVAYLVFMVGNGFYSYFKVLKK